MTTLTPKQVAFTEHYAKNANGAQAYRDAGYAVNGPSVARTEATKLLALPSVTLAIATLKANAIAQTKRKQAVTHDWMTTEYLDTYRAARDVGDLTAARMTLDSLGKLTGLMINRSEVTDNRSNLRDELAAMTLSEVLTIRDELAEALPAPGTIDSTARELHDGSPPGATDSVEQPRNMRARSL